MSTELDKLSGYTLVVCEKPDAAKHIAEALKERKLHTVEVEGIPVFVVENSRGIYLVCSALGHLYTVADPSRIRSVFPVFDVEWFPTNLVERKSVQVRRRIELIAKLARRASSFINACDFDLEGETIGYNILKYACGGVEGRALRAKFSTLTLEELRSAFLEVKVGLGGRLAEAGRARHVVDFVYGVNLSRALSEAFYSANRKYRMVSVGRVQGPTLSYVVDREIEIRSFVPIPYWTINATVEKQGVRLVAEYEKDHIGRLKDALNVKRDCEGKDGVISEVRVTNVKQSPPTPFNIGDLQREAYRVFGFSPSQTLGVAERLYLEALISYPRTSSQKLPPSINYVKILKGLSRMTVYRRDAEEIAAGRLVPKQGVKDDPAHPAIYPTGETPKRELDSRENKLYDLIVRRFFAVFGEDAVRERVSAVISIGVHNFKVFGRRTLIEGWIKYYRNYTGVEDNPLPALVEGEAMRVIDIVVNDKFEQHPFRYNQSSMLERMEKDGIGTKTTRADIINTLYGRGYIAGESMVATDLGFTVIETMKKFSPEIISTGLTLEVEGELERVERGEVDADVVIERAVDELVDSLEALKDAEVEIGRLIRRAVVSTVWAQNVLGACPICKTGRLTVIRSRRTGKRFVGCTNYSKGCRASAPLPQRGVIKASNKTCAICSWPIIYVKLSKIPWKLCVNVSCPAKGERKREVPAVP